MLPCFAVGGTNVNRSVWSIIFFIFVDLNIFFCFFLFFSCDSSYILFSLLQFHPRRTWNIVYFVSVVENIIYYSSSCVYSYCVFECLTMRPWGSAIEQRRKYRDFPTTTRTVQTYLRVTVYTHNINMTTTIYCYYRYCWMFRVEDSCGNFNFKPETRGCGNNIYVVLCDN